MSGCGPSRHFAAMQHFGRFRGEADIATAFMSEAAPLPDKKLGLIRLGLTYSVGETHIPSNITSLSSIAVIVSTTSKRRPKFSSSEIRIGMKSVK